MIKKQLPSLAYLRECFNYDPVNGELIWKHRPRHHFRTLSGMKTFNTRDAGTVAGAYHSSRTRDYKRLKINGTAYVVHRVIWALHHGDILDESLEIDHINQDGRDNRIENLRLVPRSLNQRNAKLRQDNTTGISGITIKKNGKYQVRIATDVNKRKTIGTFIDFFEACCVRKSAELRYGYSV